MLLLLLFFTSIIFQHFCPCLFSFFSVLNMICCGIYFYLAYISGDVLWSSKISILLSIINFLLFSAIITSDIYSTLSSLSSPLVFQLHICYTFCKCFTVLEFSGLFSPFFCFFMFSFWEVFVDLHSSSLMLHSIVSSLLINPS